MRPAGSAVAWLRVHPRRFQIAPRAKRILRVVAVPRGAAPGDHPALVLLTTRPLGAHRVRVRLRVGVVVVLHVGGRIVHRLEPRSLTVRRVGEGRVLELLLLNRGNVTERLGDDGLRLVLLHRGRAFARLRPRGRELLPRSAGVAQFVYRGLVRGDVVARMELRPAVHGQRRSFHVRF